MLLDRGDAVKGKGAPKYSGLHCILSHFWRLRDSNILCITKRSSISVRSVKSSHATGEAFIGQEKFSVIMESGLGLRKVYFITLYQNKKFFTSKFFQIAVKCRKKP